MSAVQCVIHNYWKFIFETLSFFSPINVCYLLRYHHSICLTNNMENGKWPQLEKNCHDKICEVVEHREIYNRWNKESIRCLLNHLLMSILQISSSFLFEDENIFNDNNKYTLSVEIRNHVERDYNIICFIIWILMKKRYNAYYFCYWRIFSLFASTQLNPGSTWEKKFWCYELYKQTNMYSE